MHKNRKYFSGFWFHSSSISINHSPLVIPILVSESCHKREFEAVVFVTNMITIALFQLCTQNQRVDSGHCKIGKSAFTQFSRIFSQSQKMSKYFSVWLSHYLTLVARNAQIYCHKFLLQMKMRKLSCKKFSGLQYMTDYMTGSQHMYLLFKIIWELWPLVWLQKLHRERAFTLLVTFDIVHWASASILSVAFPEYASSPRQRR